MSKNDPYLRTQRARQILQNVRWNYGPHTNVSPIPCDPDVGGDVK